MSGQSIGTFVGFAVGSFFGPVGGQVGAMIGGYIGSSFDTYHTPGPRLGDIPMQTSQEGAPRPIVYGTPQPFPGNIIQAGEKVRSIVEEEVDQGGKGGPTYTTDREVVHQTFAIRICEGQEGMVLLRMWYDGKLAYDATGGVLEVDSTVAQTKFTFYPGGEDQMPSPVLEALPAEYGGGVGNVPAYRGTCYVVFDNFDLTAWGGRIPQVTFQVSTNATVTNTCEDEEGLLFWYPLDDAAAGGTAREIVGGYNGEYGEYINPITGSSAVSSGPALSIDGNGSVNINAEGGYMVVTGDGITPHVTNLDGWSVTCWCKPEAFNGDENFGGGVEKLIVAYMTDAGLGRWEWAFSLKLPNSPEESEHRQPRASYTHGSGDAVSLHADVIVANGRAMFLALTYEAKPEYGVGRGDAHFYYNGQLYDSAIDVPAPASEGGHITVGGGYEFPSSYQFIGYVADVKGYERTLSAAEILDRYVSQDNDFWEIPDAPGTYMDAQGNLFAFCRETAEVGTVILADIVEDLARRAGVATGQMDLTPDEDVEVRGYLVGRQMSAQAAIGTLATTYFRDYPEYDLQIHSVPRGASTVATFTDDDFLESDDDERYNQQGIELPRRLHLAYSDPDANYARRIQMAERESVNFAGESPVEIELAVVLEADEAAQKVEIMQKVTHEEAFGTLNRKLPAYKWAELVATDRIGYDDKEWRITKLDWLDGVIEFEAKRDRVSNYTSAASGGVAIDPTAPVSSVRGPSILQALNLPRLTTAEQEPGMYLAVTGLSNAWPGADIYLSTDGGATETKVTTITRRAIMGHLLADVDASDEPIDVLVYNERVLSTITADQTNQNGVVITTEGESEIKRFLTATETADNEWEMTDVSHGLLGTTDAEHFEDDQWVLLDDAIVFLPIDISHAGKTLIFRAVTRGTPRENNDTISVVYDPQFTGPEVVEYLLDEDGSDSVAEDGSILLEE